MPELPMLPGLLPVLEPDPVELVPDVPLPIDPLPLFIVPEDELLALEPDDFFFDIFLFIVPDVVVLPDVVPLVDGAPEEFVVCAKAGDAIAAAEIASATSDADTYFI